MQKLMFNHVFVMRPSRLLTVKLKQLACAAVLGFALNTASADILYVVARGQVKVNGLPQEGVTVETIPCDGARLPADWPSPPPHTISTAVDPITGFNFSLVFTECCGTDATPGPSGSFTFLSPLNGEWFTAVDVQLKFSFSNLPPVVLSCDQVRAAYEASRSFGLLIGQPVYDVDIVALHLLPGDTAGIGFWASKNGQALINSLNGGPNSIALANWLASNFPYLFGANAGDNNLTGKSNLAVASLAAKLASISGTKVDA